MGRWRTGNPLCWPNCCRSWATAAALRGRRSLRPQSGMYHFPKTASVSQESILSCPVSVLFQIVTAQPYKDLTFSRSPDAEADSLQQISLQTINADPFLKRSVTAGTCSPPPTSPSLLSRGTYSSVLNSNRYAHTILSDPCENGVGVRDTVLEWFKSYLSNRTFFFVFDALTCGSRLHPWPLLFSIYMLPLGHIMYKHNIQYHFYADNTVLLKTS